MKVLKRFIKKHFTHFSYFYSRLRYRIFVGMALNVLVGVLDGFGLVMFLPLLQMVGGRGEATSEGMGGMSFVVDGMKSIGLTLTLTTVLFVLVAFFGLKGLCQFAVSWYRVCIRFFFISRLRYETIDKLNNFGYKKFALADPGRIQNTMSAEVARVASAYSSYFQTMQGLLVVLVYLAFAFSANARFGLLIGVGGLLSNFAYRKIYRLTKDASRRISRGGHIFQRLLLQQVSFFKYMKATAFLDEYGRKLKGAVDYIVSTQRKIGLYNSILASTREPMVVAVVAVVIYAQVNVFEAELGGIMLSLLFFYRALNGVVAVQTSWNGFLNMSGAVLNMKEFLRELSLGREGNGRTRLSAVSEGILLEHVFFKYSDKWILEDINLSLERNRTVAFVGESGCGKSTLVNLVAGLMPIDRGRIAVDGFDYRQLDKRSLQRRIGYVAQDAVVFADSIYNNVTLWAAKTPQCTASFWSAIEQAALTEFVNSLPSGEDTQMGHGGVQVSGGQKQRVSIARELYREIDLLIMDEATSALDSETERSIQENIEALHGKYTILIVAHRLSTIRHVDKIVLLKDGKIDCSGTYDELVGQSSEFRKMALLQDL